MSEPVFGPKWCNACARSHYPTLSGFCPPVEVRPGRTFIRHVKFDGAPPARLVSAEAEKAFSVWEESSGWIWHDGKQRAGALTAFSAGWIACEQSGATHNEESQTNGS